jgi:hypothetical protein
MATDRNTLKSWFQRGMKPLASQFSEWIDSFWHKNDSIPVESVEGLKNALDAKAETAAVENISNQLQQEITDRAAGDENILQDAQEALTEHNEATDAHADLFENVDNELAEKVNIDDIVDALNSSEATKPLSANMGRELKVQVDAANGSGGFIPPYDFGTATPTQNALTNYALGTIGITEPLEIFNGTKVQNLNDNRVWQLANTPNTTPPIFSWEPALVVSEAQRDFTANPIETNEIKDTAVTDTKLGNRTITDPTATDTRTLTGTLTTLLTAIIANIKSLVNRFNASTGHAHNGTDSKKIAYTDITGTPAIPAAQVNSDWNATSGVAQVLNKPAIPSAPGTLQTNLTAAQSTAASEALSGAIKLHQISKTGSYNDLNNKPSIPAAQVNSDWNATSGVAQVLNKPAILAGIGLQTKSSLTFSQAELDTNNKFLCAASANVTLTLSGTPVIGQMYIIVVRNTGSTEITITRPNMANVDSVNADQYKIKAGMEIEISFWYDGAKRRWLVSEEM